MLVPSLALAETLWRDATGSGYDVGQGGIAGGAAMFIGSVINAESGRGNWEGGDIVVLQNGDNTYAYLYTPFGIWVPVVVPEVPQSEGGSGDDSNEDTSISGDPLDDFFDDEHNSSCSPGSLSIYCPSAG